jgi:hypothetical protein
MWRLDQFRFDEGIAASQVVFLVDDEEHLMSLDDGIEFAHARSTNLVAWWPGQVRDDAESCFLGKVAGPLRWERIPEYDDAGPPEIDERLWFEASCGQRDFLQSVGGHTYRGRMLAFCPHDPDFPGYHVSLSEMGEMSVEAEYFVKGYLCGDEAGPPEDDDGDSTPADLIAWSHALRRFRETGSWFGRWQTCEICGCVLLPDTAGNRCAEHRSLPE